MKYEYIRFNIRKDTELAKKIEHCAIKKGIDTKKYLEYIIIKAMDEEEFKC